MARIIFYTQRFLLAAVLVLAGGCASMGTEIASMDDGVDILVYLRLPDGEPPFPAVVLLHGCDGRMGSSYTWAGLERHANYLNDLGIAALLVDSYADRHYVTVSDSCGRPAKYILPRVLDAYAALRHLQQDERIIDDAIGVQGASQGAAVAMRVVSSNWMYTQFAPEPGFAAAALWYPYCPTYGSSPPSKPVLILIGEQDDWTPAGNCREWVQRYDDQVPRPQLVVLEGAHHSFDLPGLRLQTFQGHSVGSDAIAYRIAREHQRRFFLEHLVHR